MMAMMQPQATISAGVRQESLAAEATGECICAVCRSGSCGRKPLHGFLYNRQIDDGGEHAEEYREPPDRVVRAGALEHDAAEPNSEEAADLVAEEGEAEQHGEPAHSKHQRDEAGGWEHGR